MSIFPWDIVTESEAATRIVGAQLAAAVSGSALVTISGDLGSGKTALVRGMCEHEQCAEQVSSPTFTIINEYEGIRRVYHIDLYRLSSMQEMLDIGLDEVFRADGLVIVEWAERALPILPAQRIEIAARHGASEHLRVFNMREYREGLDSILSPPVELFTRQT
ncbi:MAG: tRNA (adenosine(37)-N6)-threonylcarbamoyltransferase complex ATPase subunit type 1 TsaE [Bacteroidia bacterium]|nr:tRNA (adenosine(37)-N6)-threonylcarbamoyltransferase complex ATPase subunit type 1 TsaE [Bacteroidia bacterium]